MKVQRLEVGAPHSITVQRNSRVFKVVHESYFSLKQQLLLNGLKQFFSQNANAYMRMVGCLHNCSDAVSLRILDWFVTNYAKTKNTTYHRPNSERERFNVHNEYKACLKAYQKKSFDPFARRERIVLEMHGKRILTTPGQLNFFRWAISNDVISYAATNYKAIEDDMLHAGKVQTFNNLKNSAMPTVLKFS